MTSKNKNLIYKPTNQEVDDCDFVLRVAIENLHYNEEVINPELFLLRKRAGNKKEESLSVIIEKFLNNPLDALDVVPKPPSNPNRAVFRLKSQDIRTYLVGVTHTPSTNIDSHGSLHGCFDLNKAYKLIKVTEQVKVSEKMEFKK